MRPFATRKSTFLVIMSAIIPLLLLTAFNAAFAQQKKELVIISDNGFNDNDPSLPPQYHIVGEVQNNGSQIAKFVEVSAVIFLHMYDV